MPPTPCLHHIPASLTHGTQTQQGWGGPPTTAGARRVPQLPSWGLRQGKVGNRKATVKSHLEQLVGPTNAFPFSEKGDFLGMWSTILSASCVYCDLAKRNSREHATHMATCHRIATFPDHVTLPPFQATPSAPHHAAGAQSFLLRLVCQLCHLITRESVPY